jgi:cytidylate kinase
MPIITILDPEFIGGKALAERVASTLGCPYVNRQILMDASRRYGVSEPKFAEFLDTAPRRWESCLRSIEFYRVILQAAMCEIVQGGHVVYHGQVGQELLPGIRHVLKVQLIAPLEFRVEQLQKREVIDQVAAGRHIKQVDFARTRRLKILFGVDWCDPARYDLVINLGRMAVETASHLMVKAARREEYQPTAASQQALEDLRIFAEVKARLFQLKRVGVSCIRVDVEQGNVKLWGLLMAPDLEEEIHRLAARVSGVRRISTDFEFFSNDSFCP